MNNTKNIKICDVLKTNMADDKAKGDIVFEEIKLLIEDKNNINIDFSNVDGLNTAFLNNAIGKIYSFNFNERKDSQIRIINFPENLVDLLEEAIETARAKYSK